MIQRASAGERIIIARAGKPVAVLGPLVHAAQERSPGLLKGRMQVSDSFDDPLPDEVLTNFERGSIEPE